MFEAMGMEPDPWQQRLLRSNEKRALLNCCRQSGKSTTVAVLAVHEALYNDNSLVLLLSPGLRQSGELFKKCVATYRAIGRPVAADAETRLSLELSNGSRIVSLPGKGETVRGYSSVRLLIVDEASRVSDSLYTAIRPMLAVSRGRLVALSTPFGRRGWWHDAWFSPTEQWERYEITADDCPRITAEFLAEERTALGEQAFMQEYYNRFVETSGSVFRWADIEALLEGGEGIQPLFPNAANGIPEQQ
jgi:hypothetical protein